jgi:hypothetical protein
LIAIGVAGSQLFVVVESLRLFFEMTDVALSISWSLVLKSMMSLPAFVILVIAAFTLIVLEAEESGMTYMKTSCVKTYGSIAALVLEIR